MSLTHRRVYLEHPDAQASEEHRQQTDHPNIASQPPLSADSNRTHSSRPGARNHSNDSSQPTNQLNHRDCCLDCSLNRCLNLNLSLSSPTCLASYLLLIGMLCLVQAAPLAPSNLINLNDHVNPNPLNQFLKEPDLVKVYKDRAVFHIFPLAKKDVQIR